VLVLFFVAFAASLLLYTRLGFSYFPQTDAGQFVITFKAPSGPSSRSPRGSRRLEALIKRIVRPDDLAIIVDNIGVDNGFSAVYTIERRHAHRIRSGGPASPASHRQLRIHSRDQERMARRCPRSRRSSPPAAWWMPWSAWARRRRSTCRSPERTSMQPTIAWRRTSPQAAAVAEIADVFMPQDLDYPSLRIDVDRLHAAKLGLTEREVLTNVITSLTSNQMIAPNLWIDPRNGNNYFLTVQYPGVADSLHSGFTLHSAARRRRRSSATRLDMIANIERIKAPTEVDHYQIRRKLDVYARPATENLGAAADYVRKVIAQRAFRRMSTSRCAAARRP
jgi:multidrug efflux pump subunit AcrB